MRTLLDTHAFLRWDGDPSKLSARALAVLQGPACVAMLSVVSLWEILIKARMGKMQLRLPLAEIVAQQVNNGLIVLPVTLGHVLDLENLPAIHKDPFDRLLASQSRVEGASLLSVEQVFTRHPVNLLW